MEVEEETGGLLDEAGAPASAEHPDLKRLLSYWHTQRGDRSFPRRADIDPIDLHFMLERIALVEIHGEAPRRYRVRVVGTGGRGPTASIPPACGWRIGPVPASSNWCSLPPTR